MFSELIIILLIIIILFLIGILFFLLSLVYDKIEELENGKNSGNDEEEI